MLILFVCVQVVVRACARTARGDTDLARSLQIAYSPYKSRRANLFATACYLCLLWTYLATLLSGVSSSQFGAVISPISSVLRVATLFYGFWPLVVVVWRRATQGLGRRTSESGQRLTSVVDGGELGSDSDPELSRSSLNSKRLIVRPGAPTLQEPLL